MKYQCIADHRDILPIAMMCRLLNVKSGGFYAWLRRPPSQRSVDDQRYKKKVVEIYEESDGVYGSRKVRDSFLDLGFHIGRRRVARLMQELGLKGCPKKRYRITTQSNHGLRVAPNQLDREFTAEKPNQRWVGNCYDCCHGKLVRVASRDCPRKNPAFAGSFYGQQ